MEANGHGKELEAMLAQLPGLMAELTKEFIEKKDLNERVHIRMRMRALLDLAFVDTIWPTNALKKPEPGSAREMAMADPAQTGIFGQQQPNPIQVYAPAPVQPVPGAEQPDNNTI